MSDWQPPKLAVWLIVIGCVLIVLSVSPSCSVSVTVDSKHAEQEAR